MQSLNTQEVNQIVKLFKQKFVSPYKIIYMIDQKQADYFKARNKNVGCCSSAQITIPLADQSKIQRYLSELITPNVIKNSLEQILAYCEDRYRNIAEKGKSDQLKITNQVQKYLVDSILAEHVNNFIYGKLIKILSSQSKNITTQIGLWATPATWMARFPHIRLQLFQSKNLAQLFNQGYTVIQNKFDPYLRSCNDELTLLQKDGRFQQILHKSVNQQSLDGNQQKIIKNISYYAKYEDNQQQNFINLSKICLLVQSIPFELNMKANCYLTVTEAIQAYYYKQNAYQKQRTINVCKFQALLCGDADLNISIKENTNVRLKAGNLFVISNALAYGFQCVDKQSKNTFIIRSFINQANKQK